MPKKARNPGMREQPLVAELLRRSEVLLRELGHTTHDREGRPYRVWDNGEVRIAHTPDRMYRVSFKQGQVPEGLIYAGPETGKFNSYIHLAGVVKTLELLRRYMVLDDLADI